MSRPIAAVLFAAAAVLVASSPPATPQPYSVAAPAAVQVPYYGAVYGQPGGFSKADAAAVVEAMAAMKADLAAIREHLERTAPAGAKAAKGPSAAAVAKARCAGCHTPARADEHGGGFVLFTDEKSTALARLTPFEKGRVMRDVLDGTMPKGGKKLAGAELAAFESAFQK